MPQAVVAEGFRLAEPGEVAVVETEGRVFLIRLDGITPADLTTEDAAPVVNGVAQRLADSLQSDLFQSYARALQVQHGIALNDAALAAANARIQ